MPWWGWLPLLGGLAGSWGGKSPEEWEAEEREAQRQHERDLIREGWGHQLSDRELDRALKREGWGVQAAERGKDREYGREGRRMYSGDYRWAVRQQMARAGAAAANKARAINRFAGSGAVFGLPQGIDYGSVFTAGDAPDIAMPQASGYTKAPGVSWSPALDVETGGPRGQFDAGPIGSPGGRISYARGGVDAGMIPRRRAA